MLASPKLVPGFSSPSLTNRQSLNLPVDSGVSAQSSTDSPGASFGGMLEVMVRRADEAKETLRRRASAAILLAGERDTSYEEEATAVEYNETRASFVAVSTSVQGTRKRRGWKRKSIQAAVDN